jgi:PAS domain S-box-containing protein
VIVDAVEEGMPIIYANPAFEQLTGYDAAEIIGRNCAFVQGAATDPDACATMGAAIRGGRECRVTVLNYRKDGTTYWCEVHLAPVFDGRERVLQYVGVQNDVTDQVEAEQKLRKQRDRGRGRTGGSPMTDRMTSV